MLMGSFWNNVEYLRKKNSSFSALLMVGLGFVGLREILDFLGTIITFVFAIFACVGGR